MFKRTKTKKKQAVEPTYDFSDLTDGQIADEIKRAVEDAHALLGEGARRGLSVQWPEALYPQSMRYVPSYRLGEDGFDPAKISITKTTTL